MNAHYRKYFALAFAGSLLCASFIKAGISENSITNQKNSFPSMTTLTVVGSALFTCYFAYSHKTSFSDYMQKKGTQLKEFAIDKLVGPTYLTYERIKTTGLTREDLAKGLGTACALYGAKKAGDHFKVWQSIGKKDFTETQEVIYHDAEFIATHKVPVFAGIILAYAAGWVVKSGLALSMIERFRRSLTFEQRAIISSDEQLCTLIEKAHEDPNALAEHPGLVSQLHDHQKQFLLRAVEIHRRECNPLGLLDDLVFEGEMKLT